MSDFLLIDAKNIESNFALKIDTKLSNPLPTAILSFPNNTTVTIRGDEKVVQQILNRLDGLVVEWATND